MKKLYDWVRSGGWWRKEILLAAAVFPAIFNFGANLVAAEYLGLALFGQWLIWRSACQLSTTISPGFSHALTVILPLKTNPLIRWKYHLAADISSVVWGLILTSGLLFYLSFATKIGQQNILPVALFGIGLFLAGHTSLVARGRQDGKALLIGGVADASGSLISLYYAYKGDFYYFILFQGIRIWLKALLQLRIPYVRRQFNLSKFKLFFRRLNHIGFPLVARGWVQTATQYGDKLLIGLVFGATVNGATGLGSTIALPCVIISSAVSSYLLPIAIQKKNSLNINKLIITESKIVIAIMVGGALLLPVLPFIIDDINQVIQLISLGYLLIGTLSLLQIFLVKLLADRKFWQATTWNASAVLVFSLCLIAANLIGLNAETTLKIAIGILVIFLAIFVRATNIVSLNDTSKIVAIVSIWILGWLVFINYILAIDHLAIITLMATMGTFLILYAVKKIINK